MKTCNHQMIAAAEERSNFMIRSNVEVELQGTQCFVLLFFLTGYTGLIPEALNFLP